MGEVIIDTNIMVVANRQNDLVTSSCMDACIQFLIHARASHTVLMDAGDEIRAEYANALKMGRPAELGAQFLMHIYREQGNPQHVRFVGLSKLPDGSFSDFPTASELAGFDHSDRKFAVLGKTTGIPVSNATDSDWVEHLNALVAHGVAVHFVCGCDRSNWFRS
jgi:hypothetical protein